MLTPLLTYLNSVCIDGVEGSADFLLLQLDVSYYDLADEITKEGEHYQCSKRPPSHIETLLRDGKFTTCSN